MAELTVPFSVADQAVLFRETGGDPWNAILQVGTTSSIDEGRLRTAVKAACMRHPMARARCDVDPATTATPRWTIPDQLDCDPLVVRDCPDDASLTRLREELVLTRLPLTSSPPVRAYLVRRQGPDLVIVLSSHVAMDGLSTIRLALSIALAYRGAPDPDDPVAFAETRGLATAPNAAQPSARAPVRLARMARLRWALGLLQQISRPPVRVARVPPPAEATYGFVHCRLDAARMAAIRKAKPKGVSVNDLLVAAAQLTVEAWNRDLQAPYGRIVVGVPVSTRPVEWGADVIGNFISTRMIATTEQDRSDLVAATLAVAAQLDQWRETNRAGLTVASVPAGGGLPLPLKRALPGIISKLVGGRAQPTTELVTGGQLPEGLRFDDNPPPEAWLYPLCDANVGVAMLTLGVGEEICLAVRYHRKQFSPDAAARFTDLLLTILPGE